MTNFPFRQDFDAYDARPEGFHVGSWSPTPQSEVDAGKPQAPSTQVHLSAHLGDDSPVKVAVWRFKGPGPLDRLIAALIKHRVDVWGLPPHQRVWDADAKEPAP